MYIYTCTRQDNLKFVSRHTMMTKQINKQNKKTIENKNKVSQICDVKNKKKSSCLVKPDSKASRIKSLKSSALHNDSYFIFQTDLRPKKNMCVYCHMSKKSRVGRSGLIFFFFYYRQNRK